MNRPKQFYLAVVVKLPSYIFKAIIFRAYFNMNHELTSKSLTELLDSSEEDSHIAWTSVKLYLSKDKQCLL